MAIPSTSIANIQIIVNGVAATGGAGVTPSINIFNYVRANTSIAFAKSAVNTIFQANVLSVILAAMNIRYTPTNLSIRVLDDFNDAPTVFTAAGVGAIGTDSLPSDDAIYFLLRTALRGRNYRGSKHFGPASEVDTTNDLIVAGLTRWQAVGTAIGANLVDSLGNVWSPTVVSRNLSRLNQLPIAFVSAQPVNQVLLDLNVGTMRKRRSKTVR